MPHANLAIALLRQQQFEPAQAAIDRALELAPGRPDLVAIQAEVAQWSGRPDEALELMRRAARRRSTTRGCSTRSTARPGILQSEEDLQVVARAAGQAAARRTWW